MLVMFILGLILMGLLAMSASSLSGMYAAMNDLSSASRERQIDMIWEAGVSSMMVQAGPNGEYVAPLGVSILDASGKVIGHTLPSSIPGPRLNSKGYAPRYCALGRAGLSGGPTQAVSLSSGKSYLVETAQIAGFYYVIRSGDIDGMQRGSTSTLAFIISPFEKADELSCADITFDGQTGTYATPGVNTKVIPLFGANGGTLSAAEGINRSSSQFIDASKSASINEALAPYMSNPPRRLILNLPERAGGYQLTADLAFGRQTSSDAELVIAGAGSAQVEIKGASTVTVTNARLVLNNVDLEAGLQLADSAVSLVTASTGGIKAKHSEIVLDGANAIRGKISLDNSKVDQDAGLSVTYTSASTGAIDLIQSTWRLRSGSLGITGSSQYGIWVDQGSGLSLQGSTIILQGAFDQGIRVGFDSTLSSIDTTMRLDGSSTSFMDIKGRVVATGGTAYSSGNLGNGAVLRDGASILLDNGQQWFSTGSKPQVGVYDSGALSVSGTSATVGGSACWQGYLFAESTAGQVTNNNNENLQGRVNASWSCSQ